MRFTKVKYFLEKTAKTKKYLSKTIILPTHYHLRQQKGLATSIGSQTHYLTAITDD